MPGSFCRRSVDYKQHVNKEKNVELDSSDSSGVQEKYMEIC
jgi:hypothetical protein